MESAKRSASYDPSAEFGDSWQFGLNELFAIVTLAAILLGMSASSIRGMSLASRGWFFGGVGVQLLVTTASFVWTATLRKQLRVRSGRKLGSAHSHKIRWQRGPITLHAITLLSLASSQLYFAMLLASNEHDRGYLLKGGLVVPLFLSGLCGWMVCRHFWRIYPGSVEFFERGIVIRGTIFYPWNRAQLLADRRFPDRLAIALQDTYRLATPWITGYQISNTLRKRVLAAASTDHIL